MSRNIIIFGALLVLVVVAASLYGNSLRDEPAAPSTELPQVVVDARAAIDAGDLDAARSLLSEVQPDDPAYLVAAQQLALVDVRSGDLEGAERRIARALLLAPDDPGLHLDLSGVLYRKGDFVAAESEALRALELQPNGMRAVYKLGLYRTAQGRLAEGVDAYHRAITSHGAVADVEYGLRELLALRDAQPELAAAHYATAFFARTLDRPTLEVEALERFLELEPDGPVAEQARRSLERARQAPAG